MVAANMAWQAGVMGVYGQCTRGYQTTGACVSDIAIKLRKHITSFLSGNDMCLPIYFEPQAVQESQAERMQKEPEKV